MFSATWETQGGRTLSMFLLLKRHLSGRRLAKKRSSTSDAEGKRSWRSYVVLVNYLFE